jgi:3-methylcrotonyl-CoA carboxylase beta subunit
MSLPRSSQRALRLGCQLARQQRPQQGRSIASLTPPHQAAAISRLPTNVDPSSDEFRENQRQMGEVVGRMQALSQRIQQGGPEKARQKHLARGKMLPRDRVTALIDPGTTFLELSPMAGYELYPEAEVPAAGIITGVGVVEGVTCVIVANDSTVKGGSYYPITVKKHLRAQAVAEENKLPYVPFPLFFVITTSSWLTSLAAASTLSTAAAPTSPTRPTSSPIATTLAASSTTRLA